MKLSLKILPLAALLLLSSQAESFEFNKYSVHGFSYYGAYRDKLSMRLASEVTKSITVQKSYIAGFSADIGRLYNKYNSDYFGKHDLNQIYLGLELGYSNAHIKQSASNLLKSDRVIKAINLGGIFRYYFNPAVFTKLSLGVNSTFQTDSSQIFLNSAFKSLTHKETFLQPYLTLGVGFDLGYFTTVLNVLYAPSTSQHKTYVTYTLGVGVNYAF